MPASILTIDGSVLEGGGQILRNAVALSALLSKPVRVQNIRANRAQPGLKSQHAAGIKLAAEICSAKHSGVFIGSSELTFIPSASPIRSLKQLTADALTAGSTTLLLQIALPILLFSSSPPNDTSPSSKETKQPGIDLTLKGGTNASMAPQIDYTQHVFLPFLRRHFGLSPNLLNMTIERRGYYPKGGGVVKCAIHPLQSAVSAVTLLDRGPIASIRGVSHVASLPTLLAKNMVKGATQSLVDDGIDPSAIDVDVTRETKENTTGAGSGMVLWAQTENGCYLGGSAVSKKRKNPEAVGKQAADELLKSLSTGGCVDEYLQDQIIIFMALARGKSSVKTGPLTMHTKTAIWVMEQLTDAQFEVEDHESGLFTIHCQGIGFVPGC